jgi:tetratricopeptide (TPR) repeat protein
MNNIFVTNMIRFSWVVLIFLFVHLVAFAQSQEAPVGQAWKDKIQDVKDRIYMEEIFPLVMNGTAVDWDALNKRLEKKYGEVGLELVSKGEIYSYSVAKDWKNMYAGLSQFIRKYGMNSFRPDSLNAYSWAIFENLSDKGVLDEAAGWSLTTVQKNAKESWYADTYANLLYRLGRAKEAIEWEEKALALAKDENEKKTFQSIIDKMKKGQPTWPTP